MVRPGGFELPTFWFEVRFQRRQQTKANDKHLKNRRKRSPFSAGVGQFCTYFTDNYTDKSTLRSTLERTVSLPQRQAVIYYLRLAGVPTMDLPDLRRSQMKLTARKKYDHRDLR